VLDHFDRIIESNIFEVLVSKINVTSQPYNFIIPVSLQ